MIPRRSALTGVAEVEYDAIYGIRLDGRLLYDNAVAVPVYDPTDPRAHHVRTTDPRAHHVRTFVCCGPAAHLPENPYR